MKPLLANPALKPSAADIRNASRQADVLLKIRQSTPLFHLGTAARVQQKVTFPIGGPDQTPGVIVMRIDDTVGADLDPRLKGLVVVFNASPKATTQQLPGTSGQRFALHPAQANGTDQVVRRSRYDGSTGTFTVPARTVAVFVQR